MSNKTTISIKNKFDRVVVLVDMDCFYCQVEEKLNPAIKGNPIAVVQYNPWQGGGIIAVNYPARAKGVTRHMRGDEAKQHCPEIELPQVPQVRGKADLTRYREAGKEVAEVLKSFTPLLERASIDEAYLDITERVLIRIREMNEGKFQVPPEKLANTFVVGYENIGEFVKKLSNISDSSSGDQNSPDKMECKKSDIKLLVGASIVNEIRAAVKEKTGYECSAGIAHNKILAKLTAGFHKPNKQTILPIDSIPKLYETLPLKKVKGLGGKLGDQVCELLNIKFMSELIQFPESLLQQHFEERMGSWMYLMARGIDLDAVTAKFHSKSIGCCKRFPGKNAITGLATLTHWLNELSSEVTERLEKDLDETNRTAKLLTVSYTQQIDSADVASTRSVPLLAYETDRIALDALDAIKRNTERFLKTNSTTTLNNAITFLGLSAGKFESNGAVKGGGIKELFQNHSTKITKAEKEPSAVERRKSVSDEVVTESVESVVDETATNKIKNIATTEPKAKLKTDIKQLLQQQAKNAAPSKSAEKKILPNPTEVEEQQNYKETYAEFCVLPPSKPAAVTVECKQCGKQIPETEYLSHQDFHFALSLSHQQRDEFRNDFKSKLGNGASTSNSGKVTKTPVIVKRSTKAIPSSSLSSASSTSIERFLSKSTSLDETVGNSIATESENHIKCPECGKLIELQAMPEHNDYHVAKRLQQELHRLEPPPLPTADANGNAKRKRPCPGGEEVPVPTKQKIKPVSSYFSKL